MTDAAANGQPNGPAQETQFPTGLGAAPPQAPATAAPTVGLSPEFAKIVDLKGLLKLQPFDGTDKGWNEWHYKFTSVAVLLNLEPKMREVAAAHDSFDDDLATDTERQVSMMLWSLLVQCLHGRAYNLLRSYPKGHGLSVYQALVREYEPSSTA
jgi:hypothetical protein